MDDKSLYDKDNVRIPINKHLDTIRITMSNSYFAPYRFDGYLNVQIIFIFE